MDNFDWSKYFNEATIPPTVVFLLIILRQHWTDIKAAVGRLYSDQSEDRKDRREEEQKLTAQRQQYDILQASWREDKLATLLETDASFIRDTIYGMLRQVIRAVARNTRAINNSATKIERQGRIIRELAGHIAELTQEIRHDG